MGIKTYDKTEQERTEIFKNHQANCLWFLKDSNICEYNDKLCTINNCTNFRSRYLDYTPICRIPGQQCCTAGFKGKDWKVGDCNKCKIAEKYESPE